jgi:hypothetical protein
MKCPKCDYCFSCETSHPNSKLPTLSEVVKATELASKWSPLSQSPQDCGPNQTIQPIEGVEKCQKESEG